MSNLPMVQDNFGGLMTMAQTLIRSGFLPASIKTPEQAVVIKMYGDALQIDWIIAMNNINVIQGKPTVSPQLMIALARKSKQVKDLQIEADDQHASCTVTREGQTPHTEIFTIDDARRLGLANKDNWIKQPRTMLKWRAVAAAFRIVFPDVIMGFYTPEEMGANVIADDEGNMQVIDAPVPLPAPTVDYSAVIAEFRAKVKATFPDITKGDVLDALDVDDVADFDWSRGVDEAFNLVEQHMVEKAQGALDPDPEPTFTPAGEPPSMDADPVEFEDLPAQHKSTKNPPKSTVPRTTKDSKAEYERFLEEVAKPNGLTSADLNKAFGIPGDPYNFRNHLWGIESNWNDAKRMAEAYIQKQVSGVDVHPAGLMV